MIPLYAPEAVRAMDEQAIQAGVSSLVLMERAAGALARAVVAFAGHAYGLRVAIVCGKGNNGGDGIAAARRLARAGAAPSVWLAASEDELSADSAWQLRRWRAEGGRVEGDLGRMLARADVAVDCLLGTGARGAAHGSVAEAIKALDAAALPVVACDGPSGVDACTGAVPGPAVRADLTVTIGAEKVGLRLWPARGHCGRLRCADIGLDDAGSVPVASLFTDADVARLVPPADPEDDKRGRGTVLVVAGSPGMAGAAVLAVRGALAGGAGLVTLAAPGPVLAATAAALPEALTAELSMGGDERAAAVLALAERNNALVVGPGIGTDPETVRMVRTVLVDCDRPTVCDADALNAFRGEGDALSGHAARPLVLTPHRRELARLLGRDAEEVWPGRFDLVAELARRWDAVVVAKGPGTIVAAPDGRRWVNDTGGPALATGGTGDVLAGLLGALLARDARPETVAAAVHLHGRAGEAIDADRAGGIGPVALARRLPAILAEIGRAA